VHLVRLPDGGRVVESVCEVVRASDGSEVRRLYGRGGRLDAPLDGRLAERISLLRREGPP
jgi:hypothetical protein